MATNDRKMVSTANHFSNLDYLNNLNKYIPSLVLEQLIKKDQANRPTILPELQKMETVVVFADISGFTNLSEACAKKGDRGNEELAFCINRYMEGMVTNLNQYGGDIIKFVGDAMIVMWPPINKELKTWQETRNDTIRRAIQCAQDIQKTMNNLQILPGATLSVKIGIGYGPCSLLYVGGVFSRSESFTIGAALMLALRSEGQASGGGQIIVAEPAFRHVSNFFKAKEFADIASDSGDLFYLVDYKYQGQRVKIQADAMKLRSQFSTELLSRVQPKMEGCVASSIIPFLQIDQERYGSENRSLTVMFVSLGVDLSSAETEKGMNHIQKIVTEVQKQVYRMQGSLNKLLMDDKGSTLICLWGLLPFAHDDDAARALLAGFNMIKALKQIDNTYCNIGVASGEVFSGIVGTSGSRKEFSVLGDVVNLSARIMGTIKGSGAKGEIRCDLNTRMLASNFFDFQYTQHYELKGKSISIPFYKPLNPQIKFDMARHKILGPEHFLQVHQNPLDISYGSELGRKVQTKGFNDTLNSLVGEIASYYSEDCQQDYPLIAFIRGQIGSGKTAFARNMIDDLHQVSQFAPYLRSNKEKLPVFTTTVNAETQLQFMAPWQPIIQQLLTFYCKRKNIKKESFLQDIIAHQRLFDKVDILCELTGIDKAEMLKKKGQQIATQVLNTTQIDPVPHPFPFIARPDFHTQHKEELIQVLTQIVKCCVGEDSDVSEWQSFVGKQKSSRDNSRNGGHDDDDEGRAPIVLVIDNAHNMCPTSWDLLEMVTEECYRICIILLMQSDDMDRLSIHSDSIKAFEHVYNSISDQIEIIEKDLPRLGTFEIGETIRQNANKYRSSHTNEMKGMTAILNSVKTLKTDEMGSEWRGILTKKWQLQTVMQSVDDDILQVIVAKCAGNPLLCLQYFVNMLHNAFVEVQQNGDVVGTEKFDFCKAINDWSMVPVPRMSLKINTQMLDQYYNSIKMKKPQRPGELQSCISAIVLLKAASVLGEEFEIKALKQISPFPKSANASKRVEDAISILEQRDFIEIVDELQSNNLLCRFNKCFLRESIYQVLLYKSCKKDLHSATEKYLQKVPSLTTMKDNTLMTEQLLQHMKLAQDTEEESELLIERRTALVVMRVQNKINQNPRALVFSGHLYKQGDKVNKSVEQRIVTLTQYELKWFHDIQDEIVTDYYMGCVQLPFIYDVVRSKQVRNERPSFMISVTMYLDKGKNEKPKRDIYFSCDSAEERDKWMIAIDYLKTRAIFDAYAKKNKVVNFISAQKEDESQRDDQKDERDHSDLLYDFGEQLKGTTQRGAGGAMNRGGTLGRADSILFARKSSVIRPITERTELTASKLVPKLKLLYKMGMTAFLHHLDQNPKYFRTKAAIAKSAMGKQGQSQEPMQFPGQLDSWNYAAEIEEANHDFEEFGGLNTRSERDSIASNQNYMSPSVFKQDSTTNQQKQMGRKYSQRENLPRDASKRQVTSSASSSEKNLRDNQKGNSQERRSSSISADQVKKAAINRKNLPANTLIREVDDESSDRSSNNTSSLDGLTSSNKPQSQKDGRFSREVQAQHLVLLKKEQKMSVRTDSSKGHISSTLNSQLGLGQQRVSSQGVMSMSEPTPPAEDTQNVSSQGLQVLGANVKQRENRQTFASINTDSAQEHFSRKASIVLEDSQQRIIKQKMNDSLESAQKRRLPLQAVQSRKEYEDPSVAYAISAPQVVMNTSKEKYSESERSATFLEQQTFNHDRETVLRGHPQNPSIGKESDQRELSHIQHKYDSRMYQELVSSSMMDPLMQQQNVSNSQQSIKDDRGGQEQSQHPTKLMSSITSAIKKQLDQNLNTLLSEQQEKFDRMSAMQSQAMQEQLSRQQQMLDSSFQQAAILQQQQAQAQQQMSLQTPRSQVYNQQMVGSPERLLMPNERHQSPMQFKMPNYGAHNLTGHNISPSDLSLQGRGITSKRSHKHLFDSGQPCSKQDTEVDAADEPADPMLEVRRGHPVEDFHGYTNTQKTQSFQKPYVQQELDLQVFHQQQQYPSARGPGLQKHMRSFHTPHEPVNLMAQTHQTSEDYNLSDHDGARSMQGINYQQQHQQHQQQIQPSSMHPSHPNRSFNHSQLYKQNSMPLGPHQQILNSQVYQTRGPHNTRQQLQQQQYVGYQDQDEYIYTPTAKPSYGGPISDQNSSYSQRTRIQQVMPTASPLPVRGHEQDLYKQYQQQQLQQQPQWYPPQQLLQPQPQLQMQQQPNMHPQIGFADAQLVFPPPENWTETQYAMYEEPVQQKREEPDSAIRAIAVRDSVELRMQQMKVPKGVEVRVMETIEQHQVCKIEWQGTIGLFKLRDFVNIEQNTKVQSAHRSKGTSDERCGIAQQVANQAYVNHRDSRLIPQQKNVNENPNVLQHKQIDNYQSDQRRKDVINKKSGVEDIVSIDISQGTAGVNRSSHDLHLRMSSSNNMSNSHRVDNPINHSRTGVRASKNHGAVQNLTIEQMSPINAIYEDADHDRLSSTQKNFFREDPEKGISRQLRNMTAQQLADTSRKLLEEDRDEFKQKNLKLVERQKRKAQAARKQANTVGSRKLQI